MQEKFWRMKNWIFIFLFVSSFFILLPQYVYSVSATQISQAGCKTLFGLDYVSTGNGQTKVILYAANSDTPSIVQEFRSKLLSEVPRQQWLIQLKSGEFGIIYHNQQEVKYTTFQADSPVATVLTPISANTILNYPTVTELSDSTLIAAVERTFDTRSARLDNKSKCFDGLTGMAHCTQDVRVDILRSKDGGQTWTKIATLDNDLITVDRRGSFWQPRIAKGPNDTLYLLVVEQYFDPDPANQKRDTETLWKSTDKGVHWTRVNNVFTAPLPFYQANEGDLLVHPNGNLYVVFSSNYHPGAVAGEQGDYLLVTSSTDGGVTWKPVRVVGKFGPNKGPSRVPTLQLIDGNKYGITFHKFLDPGYANAYVFSLSSSLADWTSDFLVDPLTPGAPTISPVCTQNLGGSSAISPSPTFSPIPSPSPSGLSNQPSTLPTLLPTNSSGVHPSSSFQPAQNYFERLIRYINEHPEENSSQPKLGFFQAIFQKIIAFLYNFWQSLINAVRNL